MKHIALFCRWFNQKEILRFSSQAPPLMNAPGPAAVGGAAAEATGDLDGFGTFSKLDDE